MYQTCAVCGSSALTATVTRPQIPTMQNRVFDQPESARSARQGAFELSVCAVCGYARNSAFDPGLLDYDQHYDNSVPSQVMTAYYDELAEYLHSEYCPKGGLAVDIGCGKGTFLRQLCRKFPDVRGLGIDPSYESQAGDANDPQLRFIQDIFAERYITERPALVLCRHVLEHIPQPVQFLQSIHAALAKCPGVPLFFEVPDLRWTLRNGAFWDFCYEHCNYFTPASLDQLFRRAGFTPQKIRTAYGDQYLWVEALNTPPPTDKLADHSAAEALRDEARAFADSERGRMDAIRGRMREFKQRGGAVAVWGMATKGILFSFRADPRNELIDAGVDLNVNKQGKFVPITGRQIEAPEALRRYAGKPLLVIVMNPNYLGEIKTACRNLGLVPAFIDASGKDYPA